MVQGLIYFPLLIMVLIISFLPHFTLHFNLLNRFHFLLSLLVKFIDLCASHRHTRLSIQHLRFLFFFSLCQPPSYHFVLQYFTAKHHDTNFFFSSQNNLPGQYLPYLLTPSYWKVRSCFQNITPVIRCLFFYFCCHIHPKLFINFVQTLFITLLLIRQLLL